MRSYLLILNTTQIPFQELIEATGPSETANEDGFEREQVS